MKRFIIMLLTIIMCVVVTGCRTIVIREKEEVSAIVTEMQYKSSYITFISMYNAATKTTTLIPQTHPAKYLVTIAYGGISETFNDKNLYESVKEGENIQMLLCKDYDEDNVLINQTLQLPEE